MDDKTTTMIDHAKLACALVALAQGDLAALEGDLASAAAIERLGHVLHVLRQAVSACCAHCADDMLHYADGRSRFSPPVRRRHGIRLRVAPRAGAPDEPTMRAWHSENAQWQEACVRLRAGPSRQRHRKHHGLNQMTDTSVAGLSAADC
jgi:hypothetical protein